MRLTNMDYRRLAAGLTLAAALLGVGCRSQVDGFPAAPDWYAERTAGALCGVDAEYTDSYPNMEARSCLRRAYQDGVPSEMTRVSYGDEGESIKAHFRVLGAGSYEIVGEQLSVDSVVEGWVRYRCDRFVFADEPGSEIDGAPWVNGEDECEQVDWVPR